MIYYTVYKTTNMINGKIYVGVHKTKCPEDEYMGSGKILKRAIIKYGIENFYKEIINTFDNYEDAYNLEKEIVDESFIQSDDTYNIILGGHGGWQHLNEDTAENKKNKQKSGKASAEKRDKLLRYNPEWRKYYGEQMTKSLIKQYKNGNRPVVFTGQERKGVSHNIETKNKIGKANSIHQTGKKNSQYGTMWVTNGEKTMKIRKNESIPDGYVKGRKIRTLQCIKCDKTFVPEGQEKTCSNKCRYDKNYYTVKNKVKEHFEEIYELYMSGIGLCSALESVGLNRNSNRYTEFYSLCEEYKLDISERRNK